MTLAITLIILFALACVAGIAASLRAFRCTCCDAWRVEGEPCTQCPHRENLKTEN